jgi:UDP-N-acetylglucosamine 1-carboxyvinyltransferase
MYSFKVEGGLELKGEIIPQGSKNEALQIIASSILVQNIRIVNCPNIADVRNLLQILERANAMITWTKENGKNILSINTVNLNEKFFESTQYFDASEKLRGSLMLMGPLLARYGFAYIPPVGGDKIGARPIDTHVNGFLSSGAKLITENNLPKLVIDKGRVLTGEILLPDSSVTGTANLLMCNALNSKDLILYNVACETYITQLIKILESIGLKIDGAKSNRITLNSNPIKNDWSVPAQHVVLPDFIEVASFIALAMATRSELIIKNAGVENLGMTLQMFEKLGCKFQIQNDDIKVLKLEKYVIQKMYNGNLITIGAEPWPKISPDILSVGIVAALQCEGSALFHDKMYEARMFFVDKLVAMQGNIILCDPHRVVVTGNNWQNKLKPRKMTSPDIRAGIALLIAALGADGISTIDNIEQIDRGYEAIEERLALLGARITRID